LPTAPMKLRAIVARNLRVLRKQKGLTQEELAFQAGINRNYVGQIEREEKSPTVDILEHIGVAMKVQPIQFFYTHEKAVKGVESMNYGSKKGK
jgi:transcriptional regulator with XRE-family HTH domain